MTVQNGKLPKELEPPTDLTEAQLREARRNLERCLEACDEHGEEGLQAELDRIYSASWLKVPMHITLSPFTPLPMSSKPTYP